MCTITYKQYITKFSDEVLKGDGSFHLPLDDPIYKKMGLQERNIGYRYQNDETKQIPCEGVLKFISKELCGCKKKCRCHHRNTPPNNHDKPVILVKKNNYYQWMLLSKASKRMLGDKIILSNLCIDLTRIQKSFLSIDNKANRIDKLDDICKKQKKKIRKQNRKIEKLLKERDVAKNKAEGYKIYSNLKTDIFKSMKINLNDLKEWQKKNPEKAKNYCIYCHRIPFIFDKNHTHLKDLIQCQDENCSGACNICFKELNDFDENPICKCCNVKQTKECPICYKKKGTDEMLKSDNCSHYVCYKCYYGASKAGKPLAKCPMCRGRFCDHIDVSISDDSEDDGPLTDV